MILVDLGLTVGGSLSKLIDWLGWEDESGATGKLIGAEKGEGAYAEGGAYTGEGTNFRTEDWVNAGMEEGAYIGAEEEARVGADKGEAGLLRSFARFLLIWFIDSSKEKTRRPWLN